VASPQPLSPAYSLASTPFHRTGASQYADIPLSFFFLATVALVHFYRQRSVQIPDGRPICLLVLAGVAAGFAAWTKNEGLLFLVALLVSQIASTAGSRPTASGEFRLNSVREFGVLLLGVAPFLLLITWFKHSVAPGDLSLALTP
jgi:hypothetical protein